MNALLTRLAALFRRNRLEREMNDEIAIHLAMQEEEFRASGMSPDAARAAARREFGGVAETAKACRERRGIPWIESAAKDCRYALRALIRNPCFTAAAALSLALGIGANTAIFSLFHALMLRMLPVSNPHELVNLYRTGAWGRGFCSYPLYLEIGKRADLFSGVLARGGIEKTSFRYGGAERSETARREAVSSNYFAVLGVTPARGRLLTDGDSRAPLAVLSYDFFSRRFAADPSILGQTVVVDNQPLTVIGVAARGFRGVELDHQPDLWEPLMTANPDYMQPGMHWLWILGRRLPGVTPSQVQSAIDVLLPQYLTGIYGSNPNAAFRKTAMGQKIEVRDANIGLSQLRENFGRPLSILMAAVGLVLLAACANVANLLLARGKARQKEIALRLSLGATRARLIRQCLTESLLLAALGSVGGALFAYAGERVIVRFLPASAGNPFMDSSGNAVLAFTMGISLLSALLFGLVPAWRSTAVDPAESIKSGGGQAGGRHSALRKSLVVAQVAFSVMLVALAALFGRSLSTLRSINLGFSERSVIAFTVDLPQAWKAPETQAAWPRFLARMEALPGVSMVSFGAPGPFLGGWSNTSMRVPGSELTAKEPAWVNVQRIAPQYFQIIGAQPLSGREFDSRDASSAPRVAIVNQSFVRTFLPGEKNPLGRPLDFEDAKSGLTTIVGVTPDIRHQGLREKVVPTVYLPLAQHVMSFGAVLLRSERSRDDLAPAIRREVASLSPDATTSEPKTIRQQIDDSIFQDRLVATVGGFFGGLALLLAGIGLYGVVAYGTAGRAQEIGIRIAIGARRGEVLWMVLRGALALVAAGLALGLPISFVAAKQVAPVLFQIQPDDSFTFVATACVLLGIGLAAAFLPARRAASMEPMRVLRQE